MEIYRVAVKLTMESNAAAVLSTLSNKILGVHADVKKLEGGLARLNRVKMAVFGGLSIAAGAGLLGMIKETIESAKELNRHLTTTGTLVSDPQKSAALQSQALSVARATTRAVGGVPMTAAVEVFNDSYSIMGAANAARANEVLSRYAMVSGGPTGDYAKSFDNIREIIKSGELTGKIIDEKTHQVDTDKLVGYLDLVSKVSAATDNRINAKTLFQIAQQGAPGLKNMDDNGMMGVLMAAQSMGGFRAGTSTMSLFSQFAGGKMTKPVADELHKLGLVGDFDVIRGGGVQFKRGGLDTDFTRALGKDPLSSIQILRDAMSSHGITGEDQAKTIFKIFGRQTVQRLMNDFLTNMEQMVSERGRILGAQGLKQQDATREGGDIGRNEQDLSAAWANLKAELGSPQNKMAITVLKDMTSAVKYLDDVIVKTDPKTLADIGKGITILGASLIAAGGAAIVLAIGPAGWLVLGIGALAGAFRAFAPKQFEEWLGGFQKLFHGLKTLDFSEVAKGVAEELKAAFHLLPGMVQGAIRDAITAIGNFFKSYLPQLKGSESHDSGDNIGALPQAYHGSGVARDMMRNTSFTDSTGVTRAGAGGSMFDAIQRAEIPNSKHPYSETLGYGAYGNPGDLTKMTLDQVYAASEKIRHNPRNRTNAGPMGAFQILGSTMRRHARALGWDTKTTLFDKEHQEALAAHIARTEGLGAWEGLKSHPSEMARARRAGVPHVTPHVHTTVPVHLDGKIIARIVTKHQVAEARMPGSIGPHDTYANYAAAGATMFPA